MDELISVIIPVFNAAPYLEECLHSVLSQTHRELQVIVVDDGSTDGSTEILRRAAAADSRIELHEGERQGVSGARNMGIELARGEFIAFVDADDALPLSALEMLRKAARRSHADVAVGDYEIVDSMPAPAASSARTKVDLMSGETAIVRCLHQQGLDNSVWGKLYATTVFDEKLRFRPGRFEDLDIIYRIYDRARRVCRLRANVYYYRRHPQSFIQNPDAPGRYDALDVCDRMLCYTQLYSRRVKRAARSRTLAASYNALALLLRSGRENEELEERCFRNLHQSRADVLLCRAARRRDRLGALLAWLPRPLLKMIIKHRSPMP